MDQKMSAYIDGCQPCRCHSSRPSPRARPPFGGMGVLRPSVNPPPFLGRGWGYAPDPRAERATLASARGRGPHNVHAVLCRRRHQPRRPAPATIRPGRPAPAMGPGTAASESAAPTFAAPPTPFEKMSKWIDAS